MIRTILAAAAASLGLGAAALAQDTFGEALDAIEDEEFQEALSFLDELQQNDAIDIADQGGLVELLSVDFDEFEALADALGLGEDETLFDWGVGIDVRLTVRDLTNPGEDEEAPPTPRTECDNRVLRPAAEGSRTETEWEICREWFSQGEEGNWGYGESAEHLQVDGMDYSFIRIGVAVSSTSYDYAVESSPMIRDLMETLIANIRLGTLEEIIAGQPDIDEEEMAGRLSDMSGEAAPDDAAQPDG